MLKRCPKSSRRLSLHEQKGTERFVGKMYILSAPTNRIDTLQSVVQRVAPFQDAAKAPEGSINTEGILYPNVRIYDMQSAVIDRGC